MPLPRLLLLLLAVSAVLPPAAAQIRSITPLTRAPERFARMEFVVVLRAAWDDPFRSADVRLDLELTSPSGQAVTVPAYYDDGASDEDSVWHARFAPLESGRYRGRFVLVSRAGRETHACPAFDVAPSARHGFLRPATPWIFRFDDGTPFRGLGENLCWESRAHDDSRHFRELQESRRFNYDYLFAALAGHGGDFARVWMCPWNLPLEWRQVSPDTDRYTDSPARFNPSAIVRLDRFVELAEESDIHVMLTLDPHIALLGDNWARSDYNAANGGPAATPRDFFTAPAARARYRDRLRYLVARWGWSPHLAVWEFFNEVDNAMYEQKPARIPDDVVTAWHAEMSAYLKSIDPEHRLVTTSISHRDVAGLNAIPSIDFNQKHIYKRTDAIPATIRDYVAATGKPYVIGEFGYEWDWSKDFNAFAGAMDRDFKQGLWLGLFSPTPILPMSWWWEFFDERGLTAYFARVRAIRDRMLAAGGGDFQELPVAGTECAALGVRCGHTAFVYVRNASPERHDARVSLRFPSTSAERYDPETGRSEPLAAAVATDGAAEFRLSLAPDESVVLILGE